MTQSNNAREDDPLDDQASNSSPRPIRAEHKKKLAVVYIRQSSPDQVRNHTGSTESQRALAELPLRWGWPASLIRIIGEDLGLSGTSSDQRTGFQELLEMMDRGEVGLVLVRELSRLSRDPLDAEIFLTKAIRYGVLIEVNGHIYDPASRDLAALFGLRIQQLLGWYENRHRVLVFQAAKEAKIRQGYAVSRPPIGYLQTTRGKWIKDPDQAIQDAVRRLFELYLEMRSTQKVAKYLRNHGLLFPKRARGELRWVLIGGLEVLRVLTNPNYTGDYYYRRRRLLPRDGTNAPRLAKVPRVEWLSSPDHHPGYVTEEEWNAIQTMLRGRGRGPTRRPPPGKGSALLQGLLVCAHCDGRLLRTFHDGRTRENRRVSRYACVRNDKFGDERHRLSCTASMLDAAVVREVFRALSPVGIQAALVAIEEERDRSESLEAARRRQVRHAEDEVAELTRQHRRVDPEHRRLRVELEATLEDALRRRDELQRAAVDNTPKAVASLTRQDAADLVARAASLDDLWKAPTTTNEDRKHLLETVIARVVVHASTEEALDIEILWAGGSSERQQVLKARGATDLITAMRKDGRPVSEILDTITQLGVTTQRGHPFNRKSLQHKFWMLGFNKKGPRVEALLRIRSLLVARRSRQEILETLRTQGPQPYEGEWTTERITTAIKSIQSGAWAPEVPPLPADAPRLRRLPPEAIDIFIHGRRLGWTFMQIADELNVLGFRTPRGAAFTPPGAYQLYQHFKQDRSLAGALPAEAPLPALRADGQPRRKSGRPPGKGRKSPTLQRAQEEETR